MNFGMNSYFRIFFYEFWNEFIFQDFFSMNFGMNSYFRIFFYEIWNLFGALGFTDTNI